MKQRKYTAPKVTDLHWNASMDCRCACGVHTGSGSGSGTVQ